MTEQVCPDHLVAGNGATTVFLLHGGYGSKDYWKPEIEALVKAGYRVVAWDAPGYGISPLPNDFSIESLAAACVRLIKQVGTQRNVVFGHSMGGLIAPKVYELAPQNVHALVLSATLSSLQQGGKDFAEDFLEKRLAPLTQHATLAAAATPLVKSMFAPTSSGPLADLVIEVAATTPTPTFRAAMYAIQAWDGLPILQKIAVPTLCIAGRHDPVGKPEGMQQMASVIAGSEFAVIEDAGHYAWAEQPQAFNRILLDFLKRRVG
ncbi:alpha/beta fold hydrolase [Methylocella sp. CPCC 101449]|uniref:alpha/beta fold hydrolase n=1 Tax=Methylocella sp. CPCC 101449 TaxID=2987531 RepID=UPI0028926DD9|nr:alpha/beta fold hydrolase [Methylocella sp. CPCC 101449]MDT2024169.1 alpha/beta hydrolase [Methylocella sp. CPCC 101449]